MIPPSALVDKLRNGDIISKSGKVYKVSMVEGLLTYADSKALEEDYGFRPTIDIRTGLRRFAEWYKEYYG